MPAACIVLPHIWNVGRVPNFIWSKCYDFSNSFLSKSKPQVCAESVKVFQDRFFLSLENYASLAQTYVTLDAVLFIVLLSPCWLKYNVYKNSFCFPLPFGPLLKQISECVVISSYRVGTTCSLNKKMFFFN